MEIIFNGNIVPLSKFMFDPEENVNIIWKEISNLSLKNDRVIEGYSKIDAYVVNNHEVKAYVETRETNYRKAKDFLESRGYEIDRSFSEVKTVKRFFTEKRDRSLAFLVSLRPNVCRD